MGQGGFLTALVCIVTLILTLDTRLAEFRTSVSSRLASLFCYNKYSKSELSYIWNITFQRERKIQKFCNLQRLHWLHSQYLPTLTKIRQKLWGIYSFWFLEAWKQNTTTLLAPTGALIVAVVYYRSATQATFWNFEHFCQYI